MFIITQRDRKQSEKLVIHKHSENISNMQVVIYCNLCLNLLPPIIQHTSIFVRTFFNL